MGIYNDYLTKSILIKNKMKHHDNLSMIYLFLAFLIWITAYLMVISVFLVKGIDIKILFTIFAILLPLLDIFKFKFLRKAALHTSLNKSYLELEYRISFTLNEIRYKSDSDLNIKRLEDKLTTFVNQINQVENDLKKELMFTTGLSKGV